MVRQFIGRSSSVIVSLGQISYLYKASKD